MYFTTASAHKQPDTRAHEKSKHNNYFPAFFGNNDNNNNNGND